MSNQDNLYTWWWGENGPAYVGPMTIKEVSDYLTNARSIGVVAGREGKQVSSSGWNYAVLKFIIEKCTIPTHLRTEFKA